MSTQTQNASARGKSRKRILSVAVRQIVDTDADTSYLGEYGNTPKSDYAIDRATDEFSGDIERGQEMLEHAEEYLAQEWNEYVGDDNPAHLDSDWWAEALDAAQDTVRDLLADEPFQVSWDRREYRYFNPCHENYAGLPETDIRKYCRQDYDRMESLNRGNWCYIGIRAEARVFVNEKAIGPVASHGIAQTITSGGLYGIESDSGREHIEETIREELAQLKDELLGLGFSRRAIAAAFKNVQEKGD